MGDAIGHVLTSAVGIAISPLPLIAVILMLATPKGARTASRSPADGSSPSPPSSPP